MTIKVRMLLSVCGIVLLSTTLLGIYSYRNHIRQLEENFQDLARKEHRLFETILVEDAEGLSLALTGLTRLDSLLAPFAARDREALLESALPLFEELRTEHFITHMYFITPEGEVLLRVHSPGEYGDRLERATFLQAARTQRTASGLEMGKNFFSLRCVSPVTVQGELIGYMEVGEEIDHVFAQMKEISGNDVGVLLPTGYLDRYGVDWPVERIADFALLYPTRPEITLELVEEMLGLFRTSREDFTVQRVELENETYVVGLAPIRDAFGDSAGLLITPRNVSLKYQAIWEGLAISLAIFVAILVTGNLLLYLSLQKSLVLFQALRHHIQGVTRTWKLDTPLEVTTSDEIGELAEDLNLMQAEIAKLHGRLRSRNAELSAVNRELESFSYTLSHDLKLPLTRIYSAAEMLKEGYAERLDETGRLLLDHVCGGSQAMEELIEAILALANTTRKEIDRQPIDLAAMARKVAGEMELSEPERKVEWVIPSELKTTGDPQLLKVALTNLLENAWKYTRPVDHPRIEVGMDEREGERLFFVRDNGVGFDMKQAEKLFVPFKRLHGAGEIPGTGIGLATVQRIVQRHGGNIRASGAPGRGAAFFFTLS